MSAHATTLGEVLPSDLRLGPVELTVIDLARAIAFYEAVIGLSVRHAGTGRASLGTAARDLVVLVEEPAAVRAGRHAGMYHYALLFESREELAHVVTRVARARVHVAGASDHGTHEALYLSDPDGNGIELAWDRARELWPADWFHYGPAPLDIDGLMALVRDGVPAKQAGDGLGIGHLHLHVGSIEDSLAFYADGIGFEPQVQLPTAAFLSAGGYHHHLAFNLWRGRNAEPAPDVRTVAGLREWRIELSDPGAVEAVRSRLRRAGYVFTEEGDSLVVSDPAGIPLRVGLGT